MSRTRPRSGELPSGAEARAGRSEPRWLPRIRPLFARSVPGAIIAQMIGVLLSSRLAGAEPYVTVPADRVIARFVAPETGGHKKPHFVLARQLAFEARLIALSDPARGADEAPYRRHHVQAALERIIGETLLSELAVEPEPTPEDLREQTERAELLASSEARGENELEMAARAEGLGRLEVQRIFRRRARASLYLDRMVAPMLSPSIAELRRVHEEERTPFSGQPFARVRAALERWYVGNRLRAAVLSYYQNAGSRLQVTFFTTSR